MTQHSDEMREFVRNLFADPDAPQAVPDPEPDRTAGNVAPSEGGNSTPPGDGIDRTRKFVRDLFRGGESSDLHDLFHRD